MSLTQADLFAPSDHIAAEYRVWRATPLGEDVFHQVERVALDHYAAGHRRISIGAIWESVRAARHVRCNNNWRSLVSRELCDRHPELRDCLERRRRRAA